MIALAILFCVTIVASAPLESIRPFDLYGSQRLQQSNNGQWGYFTTHTPVGNLGYTAMYNAGEKRSPVAFGRLPVSPTAFAGFQPYGMAGYPNYGLRYFPGSPSSAYYPYGYQGPSYYPSGNYGTQGNYETKSDALDNQEEEEDLRQNPGNNTASNTMNPFVSAIVNFNRLNIMRLAVRNALMLMLG